MRGRIIPGRLTYYVVYCTKEYPIDE
jgi:hypothetical protein